MFPIQDPILVFTLLVLLILIAPLIAGRLRIPDLVLLLAGGALLGPNGLNLIERSTAVTMLGSVGLLYIMFIAGLEIDLNRFMRTRNRSIAFGLLTFSIPQLIGTLVGYYLLGFNWPTSILLASMFASHTLLAYPIASRLGIARSEPVVITVGGTIITDTLALLVLAVIADSAKGVEMGMTFWTLLVLGMCGLVALIAFGIPLLTRWFFNHATESGGAQFLFVITVVCGCAYLSHFAKMEPIIGAFLTGAVFNRLIPEQSALMNRLVFVGNTLFIPFFLISVGMLVNVGVMGASLHNWIVVVSMVVCVIATKYAAAVVTRKLFGYSADAGKVIFGLSVVQAAATLAAVIVGYNLKIFDEAVLNGAIAMILVSCPLGAWMVDRYGRSLIDREPAPAETTPTEQRLMVSVAHPETSLRMLNLSFLLRDRSKHGNIYPVTIVNDLDNTDEAVARGEKLLNACLAESAAAEIEISPSVRVDLNPSDGLIRAAMELRATVMLAGWSRKQLLSSRLFGTVSEKLLSACPPRLIFCHLVRPLNTTRRILLPLPVLAERRTDLTALLHDARRLARQIGATLRIYWASGGRGDLKRKINATRPTCPLELIGADTWNQIQTALLSDIGPDDLILLPGDRHSGIFWTPALDKLQEIIFARFPDNNLLCAYPPLAPETVDSPQSPPAAAGPKTHAVEIPAAMDEQEGLQLILRNVFGGKDAAGADTARLLIRAMESYPLELAENIVLLHVHSGDVAIPTVIVGRAGREWHFRNLNGAYRILLVLLTPRTMPPEQHLKILAGLAHSLLDQQLVQKIRAADSAAVIARLLFPA